MVDTNHLPVTVWFEWGPGNDYGNATPPQIVPPNSTGSVTASLAGLLPGTTYSFRLVTFRHDGIHSGGEQVFTTTDAPHIVPMAAMINACMVAGKQPGYVTEAAHRIYPSGFGNTQGAPAAPWVPYRAEPHESGRDRLVVLEDDLRHDLRSAVVHQRVSTREILGREPMRDDRIEVDQPVVDQTQDLAPDRCRIGEGTDHRCILRDEVVGGDVESSGLTGDPEKTHSPAGADVIERRLHGLPRSEALSRRSAPGGARLRPRLRP
jgi:hypothetical protein